MSIGIYRAANVLLAIRRVMFLLPGASPVAWTPCKCRCQVLQFLGHELAGAESFQPQFFVWGDIFFSNAKLVLVPGRCRFFLKISHVPHKPHM